MNIWKLTGKRAGTLTCVVAIFAGLFFLCATAAYAINDMPSSGEKQHMKLVGYNDLQGRESLQVTTKGDWVYVGHHPRPWSSSNQVARHVNPLTGDPEDNGTTIIDISDPANPVTVAHIKNDARINSRSPSVVYDFGPAGRDYLIRNHESQSNNGEFPMPPGPRVWMFEIFDITDRANPVWLGAITGSPVGSCESFEGEPCGGILTSAHKGWWSPDTGMYYGTANEPGFRGQHLMAWDLSDFEPGVTDLNSRFVGRAWLPGQKNDEPAKNLSWHHPIVDEARDRVYGCYLTGGDVLSVDISVTSGFPNYQFPVKWHIDTDPPGSGTHTVSVIEYADVPNF